VELNLLHPEMKNVLLSLKPGQISEVTALKDYKGTTFFSIVKLISKKEGYTQNFDEVKDKLLQYVSNQLQEKAINEYNQKLLLEADIEFTNKEDDWRLLGGNDPNIKNGCFSQK
jgi:parvulin-like peptidyl-prolyl isomerase